MPALTDKMKRELRAFAAACEAGLPIKPLDVVAGDKPDLRLLTAQGPVGIELSEIHSPAEKPDLQLIRCGSRKS